MNFGYLIFVSSNKETDYLRCAYAAAISIKLTQPKGYNNVALVIDDKSKIDTLKSSWVFEEVIEWKEESFWNGRSWMDRLSPFENTVCIDSDMLFQRDISHIIDHFVNNSDLYVLNKVYTYRQEIITNDFYRKTFTHNNLPNLYSMFTFFKKDKPIASDFFTLGRYIIKNPIEFNNLFLSNYKPKILGTDEAFALSAKILDIDDIISYDIDFLKIAHMKPMIQDWPLYADRFNDIVGFYVDSNFKIKIGNFQQTDVIHYVEKNIVTDEIISIMEEILWKQD